MTPNLITLSYPTTGPSGYEAAAATYQFFTADYKPPTHKRSIGYDIVHNHNGVFKYVYDNGPNFKVWAPFRLIMDDKFEPILGASATTQWQNLEDLWDHTGSLVMAAPDGTYGVHWAVEDLEKEFARYPDAVGDKIEYRVTVQFEEA
jgi:hypothetical protein